MRSFSVLIAGYGHVGHSVHRLFPQAAIHDPLKGMKASLEQVYDVCLICVPTHASSTGEADISAVHDVLSKVQANVFILVSTVPPGTTDQLCREYSVDIVFQPEYTGETVQHPFANKVSQGFIVFGGAEGPRGRAVELYQTVYNAATRFYLCSALEAELIKYMENCYFAVKVTFCNTFYEVCRAFGVDYNCVREGVLMDPRVTPWHTFVYPSERGFGGKCLPKDVSALIAASRAAGYEPKLLQAVQEINREFRRDSLGSEQEYG